MTRLQPPCSQVPSLPRLSVCQVAALHAMVISRLVVWILEHTASRVPGVLVAVVVDFGVVLRLAVYLATCLAQLHLVSVISRTLTMAGAHHHIGAHHRGGLAVEATVHSAVEPAAAQAPGLPRVIQRRNRPLYGALIKDYVELEK